MQFNSTKTFTEIKTEFKQRIREKTDKKFEHLNSTRDLLEDVAVAIVKLAAGQTVPAKIITNLTNIQTLKNLQANSIQNINNSTTIGECRTHFQTFLTNLSAII